MWGESWEVSDERRNVMKINFFIALNKKCSVTFPFAEWAHAGSPNELNPSTPEIRRMSYPNFAEWAYLPNELETCRMSLKLAPNKLETQPNKLGDLAE